MDGLFAHVEKWLTNIRSDPQALLKTIEELASAFQHCAAQDVQLDPSFRSGVVYIVDKWDEPLKPESVFKFAWQELSLNDTYCLELEQYGSNRNETRVLHYTLSKRSRDGT